MNMKPQLFKFVLNLITIGQIYLKYHCHLKYFFAVELFKIEWFDIKTNGDNFI